MAIGFKDIDPVIADRFKRLIDGLYTGKNINSDLNPNIPKVIFKQHQSIYYAKLSVRQYYKGPLISAISNICIICVIIMLVMFPFVISGLSHGGETAGIFYKILASLLGLSLSNIIISKVFFRMKQDHLGKVLPKEIIDCLCAISKFSDFEDVYLEILSKLASADIPLDESSVKDIIKQMNILLVDYRDLSNREKLASANIQADDESSIINDIASMETRINDTKDPLIKKSIEDSLSMALLRLESNRSVRLSLDRIHVHQEAIHQTFISIRSTIVNSLVTEGRQPDILSHKTKDIVVEITNRTKAVEETAKEILHIYQ